MLESWLALGIDAPPWVSRESREGAAGVRAHAVTRETRARPRAGARSNGRRVTGVPCEGASGQFGRAYGVRLIEPA